MIKKVPIPTAGLMLGLAALGNLIAPYSISVKYICGILSALLGAMLIAKIVFYPRLIKNDMANNTIFASVSATFFMAVMQLCTYTAPFFYEASEIVWHATVIMQFALMIWFTYKHMRHMNLKEVFPTYFIAYVGIVVASVTAPAFGRQALGEDIFWFGFIMYAVMFALVTARYIKHAVAEPAKPLFCIYTAPMSLSLAGYLASADEKSMAMIIAMQIAAQILLVVVLAQMPKLLALPFYPSYAAFTFPFVITAVALTQTLKYLRSESIAVPAALDYIVMAETAIAAAIVFYVTIRYAVFFYGHFVQYLNEAKQSATAVK